MPFWIGHNIARPDCMSALPMLLLAATCSSQAQELPPVGIAQAERTEIVEQLVLTGTLTSPRTARLSPEVEGRVAAIAVDAGDEVAAGEALLALDDEIAQLELAQARAGLREAVAELDDARRRLAEAQNLAERAGIADTEVRTREAEVRTDTAVVDRRKAELGYRAALVERYSLEAPFTGVIARRLTDLGEWVGPGTPVLELVAVDRLRLDLQVPQAYFGRVNRQTRVSLHLDARPNERLQAKITEIVPVSDPRARTFLARAALENRDLRMTPGMSARATLQIDTGQQGVVVPRDALIRYPDGRVTVWVANGNDTVTRTVSERQIRTGLSFGGHIEVVAGLEASTPVVVKGNETLFEGQEVRITSNE
jgi:membrane fusion protein (multidrug efflux system)